MDNREAIDVINISFFYFFLILYGILLSTLRKSGLH